MATRYRVSIAIVIAALFAVLLSAIPAKAESVLYSITDENEKHTGYMTIDYSQNGFTSNDLSNNYSETLKIENQKATITSSAGMEITLDVEDNEYWFRKLNKKEEIEKKDQSDNVYFIKRVYINKTMEGRIYQEQWWLNKQLKVLSTKVVDEKNQIISIRHQDENRIIIIRRLEKA